MNWEKWFFVFTQWMFILSVIWLTIGLVIIGSINWIVLPLVPFAGLIATGWWYELIKKRVIEG